MDALTLARATTRIARVVLRPRPRTALFSEPRPLLLPLGRRLLRAADRCVGEASATLETKMPRRGAAPPPPPQRKPGGGGRGSINDAPRKGAGPPPCQAALFPAVTETPRRRLIATAANTVPRTLPT